MNAWSRLQHARRRPAALRLAVLLAGLVLLVAGPGTAHAEVRSIPTASFEFDLAVEVPGSPEEVFDLFTGDIRPWWDHHFSENPRKLTIEPKPGGRFYEVFDDAGNGAEHARVIYAVRGETLRMDGPLGFSGHAVQIVCSLDFEAREGGRTAIKLTVRGAGQFEAEQGAIVEAVWKHFLIEQFKPYAESKLGR